MKKHFTKYLKEDLGFKPFRKINGEYVEDRIPDFSTMQSGGIDIRFIKNNIEIIWGLSEKGKPPTLIYPRPNITLTLNGVRQIGNTDDAMNICLKEENPDDIYKALTNKDIHFIYNK